jgi:iron(III) transport system substrate-binding protein
MRRMALPLLILFILAGCNSQPTAGQVETMVLYSGRSESLVLPIIDQFEAATGIDVQVRWGSTTELAATLLEEGENSPADVFFAQDPGGLGAVKEMLQPLPEEILEDVDPRFRDPDRNWVGISGRARVVVYNTDLVSPAELPQDIRSFTDPAWKGKLAWAPTNASFQTMVTAMRELWGEDETRRWLEGIQANEPLVFDGNSPIVAAVGAGEVEIGFVNHYYLFRFLQEEGEQFAARNYFMPSGGPDALVMTAGVGMLKTAKNTDTAARFVEFMLSSVAQQYFATQTYEYPVVEGVNLPSELVPLSELNAAQIDLAELSDLQNTVALLQETEVLP